MWQLQQLAVWVPCMKQIWLACGSGAVLQTDYLHLYIYDNQLNILLKKITIQDPDSTSSVDNKNI